MSAPVKVLDFKITGHGTALSEYVLRLVLRGDTHVDFLILPDLLEELGREATAIRASGGITAQLDEEES